MEKSQIRHIQSLIELRLTKTMLTEKCGHSAMTIHRVLAEMREKMHLITFINKQ